jgi:hypothetical protein
MAAGAFGRQLAGGQAAADSKSSSSLNETRSLPAKPTQASNGGAAGGETGGGSATPASGQAKSSQIEGKTEADLKTTAAVVEGVGKISERSPAGEVAAEVARIHKAFLDDDNLDALLVACITSLSHEGIKDGQQTSLSQICKKEIFENFVEKAAKVIETKARAEVLITRARTATVHSEAIAKCLDVFKSDATPCLPLINATPNLGAGVTVTKTSVTP